MATTLVKEIPQRITLSGTAGEVTLLTPPAGCGDRKSVV